MLYILMFPLRLPRFRLFGDTMNTAARMMQKGLPGEVRHRAVGAVFPVGSELTMPDLAGIAWAVLGA